jgi:signal transduction histidine kinase
MDDTDALVAQALARQEMDGERFVNGCRIVFLVLGTLDLAWVWRQQTRPAVLFFFLQGLAVSAYVLAVAFVLRDRRRYRPALKYVTVVCDVSFAYTYTLASFLNYSGVYAVYRSPFMWLALATVNALSGMRYQAAAGVLAGSLTLVYGAIQLLVVSLARVQWSSRLDFVGRQFNFANCVQTIALASVPAWVAAAVAHRSRNLIKREARAAAERASFEERERRTASELTAMRELAAAKERFLGIASHELRSPIASLRSTVQLGQLDPSSMSVPERRAELLARLDRQALKLNRLVEQLLESARLGQNLPLQPVSCDLVQLCKNGLEVLAGRERICFEAPETIIGVFDPMRIEQVASNLMSNALRYSPPETTVRVTVRTDGTRATLTVTDAGMGIDPAEIGQLFSPFARTESARRAHGGGLGLGLYIVHEIVRRHGGSIRVDSKPGRGSTFVVDLPLLPVVA